MDFSLSQAAATALANLGLAWIVGVLAFRFWLRKNLGHWRETVLKKLSLSMTIALIVCASGTALSLWAAAMVMGDVAWFDAGPVFSEMLSATRYGHAGAAALSILVVAMFSHWRLARSTSGASATGIVTVLVVLFAVARVSVSHAFEHGAMSIAVLVELLHLLFMALWVGAVFIAGWIVLPAIQNDASSAAGSSADYLKTLSDWASVALIVILVTGAYNLYRVVGSLGDMFKSEYGNVLVFKLCFVLVAIGLGAVNRFYGLPMVLSATSSPMKAQRGLRMVIDILRIESIVLLLVVMAAAVLTSSAPPGG